MDNQKEVEDQIVHECSRLLRGRGPVVQGQVITRLMSQLIAGFGNPAAREDIRKEMFNTVKVLSELISVMRDAGIQEICRECEGDGLSHDNMVCGCCGGVGFISACGPKETVQ